MTPQTVVILVLVIVLAVAVVAILVYHTRRRAQLRAQFGPEYDRAVKTAGSTTRAETALEARARRVRTYSIVALSADDRARYSQAWRQLQARFVDEPSAAVAEADTLVTDVMARRGYPMTEFEQRAEDLSVDHPAVVDHYREAHRIAVRHADVGAGVTTEDLRQALVHYRALFEDLLGAENAELQRRRPA
jgi:hypothetical protein